jgi:rsbT antagonist protein RsbS
MSDAAEVARVTINQIRGCLVATIQVDLGRDVLERFRRDLLERVDATRVRQVILDCSAVEVMDGDDFDALRRTIAVAALMGTRTILAGLQPGVVSALIDLDVDLEGLRTALSLNDAFRTLEDTDDSAGEGGGEGDDVAAH